MLNNSYTVVDLFAGVGGLSYGFSKNDAFKIVAANELLPDMAKAYALNHPDTKMYNCDIKDFGLRNLQNNLYIDRGEIDVIIGGPPCQAYSTLGKRAVDDPRGQLFEEYYRILAEISPTFFIFENVRGLLSMDKGKLIEKIVKKFESLGYHIKYKLLNAVNFGAPQFRERVIITGSKFDSAFEYPHSTHGVNLKSFITLGEAIGDLPLIKSGESSSSYACEPFTEYQRSMRKGAPEQLVNHNSAKNNAKLIAIMKALPEGGSPRDIPKDIRPTSGYGNTYCKLWWNAPSTTITRNLGTPSSSRCIHPKVARALTTREGARLQGFPDSYQFYGSRTSMNLQIGNAVPTQLSTALAKSVQKYLDLYQSSNIESIKSDIVPDREKLALVS